MNAPQPGLGPVASFRVLIVDDDPSVRRTMGRTLHRFCEVDVAVDGVEALALLRAGAHHALILSDVSMPRMNGFELLDALRAEVPHAAARFAFMTGGARNEYDDQRIQHTGVPILPKPFNTAQLIDFVKGYGAAAR